jgi:peptidoglycan/xylan/chitin deacetylase (PgdA/CDA1 family)
MASIRVCAPASPIPILTYHQIDVAPPKGAAFRSLYVAPAAFARQMGLLKHLGYRGLSMTALLPYLKGEQRGKVCGITFDDGYVNNLHHALPVLQALGFSSTCYVVSQQLGLTNDWDHVSGMETAPLMDGGQLRQWIAGGQEVGAHTRHHPHLSRLTEADSAWEIAASKGELEKVTQAPVKHFCYPYGDFGPLHPGMVAQAGFATATTTVRSRCQAGDGVWQLPRVPVLRTTTLPVLWLKLATTYEDRRRV